MVVMDRRQGILQNQSGDIDKFHREVRGRAMHMRKRDKDVSERVSESRVGLRCAGPR